MSLSILPKWYIHQNNKNKIHDKTKKLTTYNKTYRHPKGRMGGLLDKNKCDSTHYNHPQKEKQNKPCIDLIP